MLNAVSTRVLGHGLKQIQVPAAAFLWQWAAGSFLSTTSCQLLQQEQKHNKNSQSQDLAKQEQQKQRLPRLPDGVIVLPMPALSHTMVSGKVAKWLKSEGEKLSCQLHLATCLQPVLLALVQACLPLLPLYVGEHTVYAALLLNLTNTSCIRMVAY
jgi:hypothetical protein